MLPLRQPGIESLSLYIYMHLTLPLSLSMYISFAILSSYLYDKVYRGSSAMFRFEKLSRAPRVPGENQNWVNSRPCQSDVKKFPERGGKGELINLHREIKRITVAESRLPKHLRSNHPVEIFHPSVLVVEYTFDSIFDQADSATTRTKRNIDPY